MELRLGATIRAVTIPAVSIMLVEALMTWVVQGMVLRTKDEERKSHSSYSASHYHGWGSFSA